MAGRAGVTLEVGVGSDRRVVATGDDAPMRILVMGDLTGRTWDAQRAVTPLDRRRPIPIDVDSFDAVMAGLAPRVHLAGRDPGDPPVVVEFPDLDAFHPDALYARLDTFEALRTLRRRLLDPATFEEAVAAVRARVAAASLADVSTTTAGSSEGPESDAATFARLLGQAARSAHASAAAGALDALVRRITAPHIVAETPQQEVYRQWLDAEATDRVRAILHDPAVQALESTWRSVHALVTALETGERLEVAVLDVTRAELLGDLDAVGGAPDRTQLFRLVQDEVRAAPDARPWALLVAALRFGADTEDLRLLAMLAIIAARAGGPFLASADPSLLGCRSLAETPDPRDWTELDPEPAQRWHALRRSAVAPWVGLALPRVLLRLPYGEATEPCEQLEFEELTEERTHEAFLWGNPAFVCAQLIGQAFLEGGWVVSPNERRDLADLPAYTYRDAGETRLQACAEVLLSDGTAAVMLDRGLMPLLSYRDRNAVRVARFQSIALPCQPLAGRWP